MKNSLLLLGPLLSSALLAANEPHAINSFVGVASDYVYRGISRNQEDPAFQFGVNFKPASGWFVDGFVSQVDFDNGADFEARVSGGIEGRLNSDWTYKAGAKYSNFLGEDGSSRDYLEAISSATFKKAMTFSIAHTFDFYGYDESATYFEGRFNVPAHDVIKLSAIVGYYSINGKVKQVNPMYDDYLMYGIEASTHIGEIDFTLAYTDTDIDGYDEADSRLVVSGRYSF